MGIWCRCTCGRLTIKCPKTFVSYSLLRNDPGSKNTLNRSNPWINKESSLIIISGPRYWGLLDSLVYSMLAGERVLTNEWANGCWWFFVKSQEFVNIYGMLYIMISWNMVGETHPTQTTWTKIMQTHGYESWTDVNKHQPKSTSLL